MSTTCSSESEYSARVRSCLLVLAPLLVVGCETVELRAEATEPPADDEPAERSDATEAALPEGRVTALAVGPRSSCAIVARAELWCWGSAGHGLLGESAGPGPVRVAQAAELSAVSVTGDRVCYLAAGVPHCFGVIRRFGFPSSIYGEDPVAVTTPERVRGIEGVEALAIGPSQSCFLTGGAVRCLGNDSAGAGRGARTGRLGPPMGEDVRSVAAGSSHTCAADASGAVSCWGSGYSGQLPGTDVRAYTLAPTVLPGITGVRQIAAGPGARTCALGPSDAITCWGHAGDPQARAVVRMPPTPLEGAGEPIARIAVGPGEVLALGESGALYRYAVGEARREEQAPHERQPALRAEFEGPERLDVAPAVDVGMGLSHTCALGRDAHVRCWGLPIGGRLGQGRADDALQGEVRPDAPIRVRFDQGEDT